MESAELSPAPAETSEMQRLNGVFFSPGSVFPNIAAQGRWWLALLILIVLPSIFTTLMVSRVGYDRMIQKGFESSDQMQQMTPEQRQHAFELQRKIMPWAVRVGPVVVIVVVYLVIAGVLLFVFKLMFDAGLNFKQTLNISTYAGIPPSVVSVCTMIAVLYLKAPDDFDPQNPLAFNAGAFLSDGAAKWIKSLAGSIDLFSFWSIALLAIGISATVGARRMPIGRALTGIVVPWVIYVIGKAAFTALFG